MIHLTQYETPAGEVLGYTVEAVNCPDPECDLTPIIGEGCTVMGDQVHYFKSFTVVNGYNAKRKALILSELLCTGMVQKTEVMTVEEFEG
jgi:hypothetical protein